MKYINIFIFTAILFFNYSCSDFLEKEPLVSSNINNFYKNAEEANAAVISAYNPLQSGALQWSSMLMGDACSDDAVVGSSMYNPSDIAQQLALFTTKADNTVCLDRWNACFQGISKANYAIKYISIMPQAQLDSTLNNQYVGEAKFLRAYYYFLLVTTYGGVPILNEPLAYSEYKNQVRASEAQVWDFIEKDLNDALQLLSKRKRIPASETGRITLGAVNALLAKVYLFQGKYAQCQSAANQVISSRVYRLETDYNFLFTLAGENNKESIFEVQHQSGGVGEGSVISWFVNGLNNGGLGFDCPTQDLVDAFEYGKTSSGTDWVDPRMNATIIFDGEQNTTSSQTGYYNQKMYVSPSDRTSNQDSPKNLTLIRYADVLLMFAEAANRNGRSDTAVVVLNSVRQRARNMVGSDSKILPAFPYGAYANTVDDIEKAIWHERRVELAMEFGRFWDLKRQKRLETVMHAFAQKYKVDKGKFFDNNKHYYFPIPENEITLTYGNLTQNPGY